MTTVEVRIRNADRQVLLNPMIGRLQSELLDPILGLVYEDLKRTKSAPALPRDVEGSPLNVSYLSPLALNQRVSEVQNLQNYMQVLAPLIEQDPSYIERLHPERLQKWLQSATNVPQVVFRTSEEYEALLQRRREQQNLESAGQAAQQFSAAAKDAASAQAVSGGAFDLQLVA